MSKIVYDARKEFKPFPRSATPRLSHPNKGLRSKHPVSGKKSQIWLFED